MQRLCKARDMAGREAFSRQPMLHRGRKEVYLLTLMQGRYKPLLRVVSNTQEPLFTHCSSMDRGVWSSPSTLPELGGRTLC
jgi:hypothetical protein